MKIVIPLAGKGTRLKPFTLTKAKAMVPVAGKPVLQHIMEQILATKKINVEEVIFIIGYLGNQIKTFIEQQNYPFAVRFLEQKQLLGQAHAVKLAEEYLKGDVLIWFVDTISDAQLDDLASLEEDGAIYVKEVKDPRRFGQVKEENGIVTEIKEKADPPISSLVNIGLYYVKDAQTMLKAIDWLIDNDKKKKGEFYLMDAFDYMIQQGTRFKAIPINVWVDCGMPDAFLETNKYLLDQKEKQHLPALDSSVKIIPPVFIADSAKITQSTIGPYVAIGENAVIENSTIKESIVLENTLLQDVNLQQSMIGEFTQVHHFEGTAILGPWSELKKQ